ncbi:MAG: hypothetical protein IPG50_38585 [Myxococcales bacterium]|nr:hypothetical protein [Myxococcales bacterium]
MLFLLLSFGAFAAGTAAFAGAAVLWLRHRRRQAVRRRLGAPIDVSALGAHQGKRVVLRGTLDGGELTTRFGPAIRATLEVHPDATSSRPERLALRSGGQEIELAGAAQVILGEREETADRGDTSVRRVNTGATVLASGVVMRNDEGGYREPRFSLTARPEGAWVERPVGVFAEGSSRVPLALTIFGALGWAVCLVPVLSRSHVIAGPPPKSAVVVSGPEACRADILARLDRNDLFGAEGAMAACPDARAKAETLWSLGRVDEAATAFKAARGLEPWAPYTLSEVEATVVSAPRPETNDAVRALKKDWYRGLPDASQKTLDCLAGTANDYRGCMPEANLELSVVPGGFGNPVGVVTDTFQFALDMPRWGMRGHSWDETYGDRCTLVGCRAAKNAALALFAALAADGPRAAKEFAVIDTYFDEYALSKGKLYEQGGITTHSLLAQDAFVVAAVAAWFAHDEARTKRYLGQSEAHAADTLAQHLALSASAKPPRGDSSKWSSVDLELHGLADHEEPAAFVRRLKDLSYTHPLRLHALLGARPRLHVEARKWVEGEFVPACRSCGLFAVLEATARRREAARAVGAKELEAKLAEVSRRFGEAWQRDASRKALWTLELLYHPH